MGQESDAKLVVLAGEFVDLGQPARLLAEIRNETATPAGLLMKTLNLSEPDSFSWIQRTAMDRRISMKAVALAVISPDAVPEQ